MKYRVDFLFFDMETTEWKHVPGWEYDGKAVRPLCELAKEYTKISWERTYTPDDGMQFMNVLHKGVHGSFVKATEPYEVRETVE